MRRRIRGRVKMANQLSIRKGIVRLGQLDATMTENLLPSESGVLKWRVSEGENVCGVRRHIPTWSYIRLNGMVRVKKGRKGRQGRDAR